MASNAVARTDADSPSAQLTAFRSNLERRADDFAMVLPSHISPEKFQRTVLTAVASNPALLKADRQSLLLSCMKAAQDALLPDGREAALVVFSNRVKGDDGKWYSVQVVQYMPMVFGLRKKILQSGEIADITTKVVYRREFEEGAFIYEEGTEAALRHRPLMDLTAEQTADDQIVAAYSMATTKDGFKSYEVMRRFEIDRVRQTSQTGAVGRTKYNSSEVIPPKGPWVDWFPEMARKTVMRRHSKLLPMSGDLVDVEAMDDAKAAQSSVALFDAAPDATPPRRLPDATDDDTPHDAQTGEVLSGEQDEGGSDASQAEQAKPKPTRAKKQAADDAEKKPDTEVKAETPAADDSEEAVAARIETRIAEAKTIIAVSDIEMDIPDTLGDEAKEYLLSRTAARKSEIRAEALKAQANG